MLTNLYPPHHLGGYELICRAVVDNLTARGHDVRVLTSRHRRPGRAGAPEGTVECVLRINGLYGHAWVPMRRLPALEAYNNRMLRRILAAFRPDLVHVWAMGGLSKSLLLTLQALGLPTVFHVSDHWIAQGLSVDPWLAWWNAPDAHPRRRLLRSIATRAGLRRLVQRFAPTDPVSALAFPRLSFCSRRLRELTVRAGFAVRHGEVIPCPVDTRAFNGPPRDAGQPLARLLWAGRLCPEKGVLTALQAMALLGEDARLHLDVYGRGEEAYEAGLRAFAREHGLRASFGAAEPEAMPAVYRAHDALLFTSEWEEPFALTPLEAMASGLPVIATTTGGSAELFRHGENALTFTAGDPRELANRILTLARDGALRARLAAAGQAEVRAGYAEDRIVDRIEAYLVETVEAWQRLPTVHSRMIRL